MRLKVYFVKFFFGGWIGSSLILQCMSWNIGSTRLAECNAKMVEGLKTMKACGDFSCTHNDEDALGPTL